MKLHFWRDVAFGGCLRAKRRLIYFTSFSVFLGGYVLSALPASCASQASPIRLILSVCGLLTIYSWVQHCIRAEGMISYSISFAAYFLRLTVLLMFSAIDYAQSLLLSEKFFEPILVVIRYWCDTLPVHLHWLLRELFAVYDASKGRLIEIRRMPWWCAKDQLCAKALVLYQRTWVTRASCRCRRMKSFWSLNSASADRSILLFCSHAWSPRWSFIVLCDFLVDKLA